MISVEYYRFAVSDSSTVALAGWHIALLKIAAFCMFQYKSTLWYCLGWVSEQVGGRRMQGAFGQTPTP